MTRWRRMAMGLALAAACLPVLKVSAAERPESPSLARAAWHVASDAGPQFDSQVVLSQEPEEQNPDEEDRVPVQVWTVVAAAGAAAVGLLGYLLRLALGRVKPPPPPEDVHH